MVEGEENELLSLDYSLNLVEKTPGPAFRLSPAVIPNLAKQQQQLLLL
jgi:hypothetical protein